MGKAWWLRVPVGKLHNDRYVPLLPSLVTLIAEWIDTTSDHGTGRLITKDARSLNRYQITRVLNRVARQAGVGHVLVQRMSLPAATRYLSGGTADWSFDVLKGPFCRAVEEVFVGLL